MATAILDLNVPPLGSIIIFAGEENKLPKNWVICDGRQLSKAEYPDLFDALGTVWGGSDDSHFYIPDLRGVFLRGVSGGNFSMDSGVESRTSPRPDLSNPGNNADKVGSHQKMDNFKGTEAGPVNVYIHYIIKAYNFPKHS